MTQLQNESQFSEEDERLFSSARTALLTTFRPRTDDPAPDRIAIAANAKSAKRTSMLGHASLVLAAALILLARWKPSAFGAASGFGMLLFVIVVFAYFIRQGKALTAARKRNDQVIDPSSITGGQRSFLASAIVAVVIGLIIFPPTEVLWFFAVVLLHETGHYLAMRIFGYQGLGMAFTYTGAVTRGDKENVPAWQQATVLPMGPLPGLVIGCGVYFLHLPDRFPFLRVGASWLVTLNFINLMPLGFADGDKLISLLLFRRSSAAITKLVIPAIFLGIYLSCDHSWHALALAAICIAFLVPNSYRLAAAINAMASRHGDLPARMKDMTDCQWRDLFKIARQRFSKASLGWGFWMKTIYEYAIVRPAPARIAAAFGAVYFMALTLAVSCALRTTLRNDAGLWPILPTAKIADLRPPEK